MNHFKQDDIATLATGTQPLPTYQSHVDYRLRNEKQDILLLVQAYHSWALVSGDMQHECCPLECDKRPRSDRSDQNADVTSYCHVILLLGWCTLAGVR